MKSLRICKSTVSMVLALIMLVSMCTVAFINTAAAVTDVATTGDNIPGGTKLWLKPASNWKSDNARFACYFFIKDTDTNKWHSATYDSTQDAYWVTAPTDFTANMLIWCRMNPGNTTNSWDTKWNQTADLEWKSSYGNCWTVKEGTWDSGGGSWSTITETVDPTEPEVPDVPGEEIVISFLINSDTKWVATEDAKMFIKAGSKVVQMDETVDTKSGHIMWTAEVPAYSSYTFYRTSYYFDEDNASTGAWNSWTASSRNSNTVYKATGSGTGSWDAASAVNAADPKDINNFWDDLWIDTVGDGNPEHAVKVYFNGSTFDLFVPSYVDLSDVTVYSDHEKVVIGGTEYASGSKANLTTGTKTFAFKDGSTTTNKQNLNIYQTTGTSAMLMTTKEELYTSTTAAYYAEAGQTSNAWPSGSGITAENYNNVYKDAIETKGTVFFYDEEGNLINTTEEEQVLKKIKGRGNSSFEASMRIYGKYAYNFNLDKKLELADDAVKSKKWCLMANNVDHAMLRNTFVYSLAADVGIKYAPKTKLYDVYDNGKYLGAYSIAEKVEYGGSTLMEDMENLDDGNEEANIDKYGYQDVDGDGVITDVDIEEEEYVFDFDNLIYDEDKCEVNGQTYTYQYTKSDKNGLEFVSPEGFADDYNFLLEFELFNRYKNEASWFVSPRTGQSVVVKYPEFATKDEMEWIIKEYEEAESAIYANDYTAINNAIDVDSFVRMYLIQELAINLDSCATSYYIHNDQATDKLVSSPVWDYDWAFGSYAGTTKYIYNGSSVTTSKNMSEPKQMFVKDKALQTDSNDNTKKANYNFQAKLVHNETVWNRCKSIWTNDFVPALGKYIDNDYADPEKIADDGVAEGKILTEWLPSFTSSVDMNNARWGVYNFTGDDWGTKVTSDYVKRSFDFKVGNTGTSGSATTTKSYANTVYYLNDWIATRWNYMSSSTGGALYDANLKETYKVEDVAFEAVQNESQLTVTPSATVTLNGAAVATDKYQYTIYLNGTAVGDPVLFTTPSTTITLPEGQKSSVYVKVTPVDDTKISGTSSTQTFSYGVIAADIDVTVYFKSSSSYRYIPKVTVGDTEYTMKKDGSAIAKNASGTQQYYWYKAVITVKEGEKADLLFTNAYSMRATTSITVSEPTAYYFAVDNLNNGSALVDLTDADTYIKNFVKSATHMVTNDPEEAGIATTSIDGTIYKMGDADEDNTVTILDATAIQYALAQKTDLTDTGSNLADFDLDTVNSIMDVTNIQINLVQG